jgi:hypothetical protein
MESHSATDAELSWSWLVCSLAVQAADSLCRAKMKQAEALKLPSCSLMHTPAPLTSHMVTITVGDASGPHIQPPGIPSDFDPGRAHMPAHFGEPRQHSGEAAHCPSSPTFNVHDITAGAAGSSQRGREQAGMELWIAG